MMAKKVYPASAEKQASLDKARYAPENQKYLEERLDKQLTKYKARETASLKDAFLAFSYLTLERRQAFLEKNGNDFFRLLLESDQRNLVYRVLEQGSPSEQATMQTMIHKDLKRGLAQAIADGNISKLDHYMDFFRSPETENIIKSVIAKNDYACLKETKNNQKAIVNYLLKHELTSDDLQARFLPQKQQPLEEDKVSLQKRQKPQADGQSTQSYFSSIKARFQSFVGAGGQAASKVGPGTSPVGQDNNDFTDSETDSESSDYQNRI